MASPLKRLTTTRSVVEARTAVPAKSTQRLAVREKKAIRRPKPYLSCRSVVIDEIKPADPVGAMAGNCLKLVKEVSSRAKGPDRPDRHRS
jgi:hypothetical protein